MHTLDRFRASLKFSLWAWALYWPGGGLLLLVGGLDPISILVVGGCVTSFLVLLAGGALRTTSSRNLRDLFLERPLYLIAALVLFIAFASLLPALENAGLLLYSATWTFALGLVAVRFHRHVQEEGIPVWSSRADQVYLVLGLTGAASIAVFLDALLPFMAGTTLGSPATFVAVCSWVNILFPPLVMVATRPFREPLSFRRAAKAIEQPVPVVVAVKA